MPSGSFGAGGSAKAGDVKSTALLLEAIAAPATAHRKVAINRRRSIPPSGAVTANVQQSFAFPRPASSRVNYGKRATTPVDPAGSSNTTPAIFRLRARQPVSVWRRSRTRLTRGGQQ